MNKIFPLVEGYGLLFLKTSLCLVVWLKLCNVLENAILFNCRWTFTIVTPWRKGKPLTWTNLNKFQDRRTMIQQKTLCIITIQFLLHFPENHKSNFKQTRHVLNIFGERYRDEQSKPIHKLNINYMTHMPVIGMRSIPSL